MRVFALALVALAVSTGDAFTDIVQATMPVEIRREEGQTPRMGYVSLKAGGYEDDDPFSFFVLFNSDGVTLGQPIQVSWSLRLGDYCRDRPTAIYPVLTGPSGQTWRGARHDIPAGRNRLLASVRGTDGAHTPGLLAAMADGGVFTLAIEDEDGERLRRFQVDTLRPSHRLELFALNQQAVRDADSNMPVSPPIMKEDRVALSYTPPLPHSCP